MRPPTSLPVLVSLAGFLGVALVTAAPAAAWDGPGMWHRPADDANPGGGGIFGTGGARDYKITCEDCHVGRPPTQTIDAALAFAPQLGAGDLYTPGQSYQVTIDLVGEFQGLSGCGPYTFNVNNFAADFEDAGGTPIGVLTSDSGQTQTACPFDYPMPTTGTTGLYRDCEVVFGRDEPGLTSWTFSWRAPSAGAGPITMHFGVVDGDCGMMSMNDAVKVGTRELGEGMASRPAPARRGGLALALLLFPVVLLAAGRRALAVACLALLVTSCGGSAKEDGTLGGKCLPGGACAAGLMCQDDVCVEETAGGDGGVDVDATVGGIDATIPDANGSPPTAQINHPGDGEMRPAGEDIPFIGVASDPEDGQLSGASMVWTSDLAGPIGTGASFNAPLAAGMHVVTLTATDSDGNTGTDQITLIIE